jgi:hypothetical protein
MKTAKEKWEYFNEWQITTDSEYSITSLLSKTGLSEATLRKYLTADIEAGKWLKRWYHVGRGAKSNPMGQRRSMYLYSRTKK